jgi:hypothetical protein
MKTEIILTVTRPENHTVNSNAIIIKKKAH